MQKTKYIAYVATSIDGRIAHSSKSGIDWTSREDSVFYHESLSHMDVVIVGYNTYKLASRRSWKDAIILTSKTNLPKTNSRIIFLDPQKTNLKKFIERKNYKKVAIIGGGRVYAFCLKNKMMDELFVTIEPYVFTNGISMFLGNTFSKYKFTLQSIKRFNKRGSLLLRYKNEN